jgi:hypothetical protein
MPSARITLLRASGDNRRRAVRHLIRAAGAKLFFLPRYSPDLNPIERVLRQAGPTHLIETIAFPAAEPGFQIEHRIALYYDDAAGNHRSLPQENDPAFAG